MWFRNYKMEGVVIYYNLLYCITAWVSYAILSDPMWSS